MKNTAVCFITSNSTHYSLAAYLTLSKLGAVAYLRGVHPSVPPCDETPSSKLMNLSNIKQGVTFLDFIKAFHE